MIWARHRVPSFSGGRRQWWLRCCSSGPTPGKAGAKTSSDDNHILSHVCHSIDLSNQLDSPMRIWDRIMTHVMKQLLFRLFSRGKCGESHIVGNVCLLCATESVNAASSARKPRRQYTNHGSLGFSIVVTSCVSKSCISIITFYVYFYVLFKKEFSKNCRAVSLCLYRFASAAYAWLAITEFLFNLREPARFIALLRKADAIDKEETIDALSSKVIVLDLLDLMLPAQEISSRWCKERISEVLLREDVRDPAAIDASSDAFFWLYLDNACWARSLRASTERFLTNRLSFSNSVAERAGAAEVERRPIFFILCCLVETLEEAVVELILSGWQEELLVKRAMVDDMLVCSVLVGCFFKLWILWENFLLEFLEIFREGKILRWNRFWLKNVVLMSNCSTWCENVFYGMNLWAAYLTSRVQCRSWTEKLFLAECHFGY